MCIVQDDQTSTEAQNPSIGSIMCLCVRVMCMQSLRQALSIYIACDIIPELRLNQ